MKSIDVKVSFLNDTYFNSLFTCATSLFKIGLLGIFDLEKLEKKFKTYIPTQIEL
jgi:hypothetical protein